MAKNQRRATRQQARKQSAVEQADQIRYFAGQGIAIKENSNFTLYIIPKDISSKAKTFKAIRLVDNGDRLMYSADKQLTIKPNDVDIEVEILRHGNGFRITKAELMNLLKELGLRNKPPKEDKPPKMFKGAKGQAIPKLQKGKFNPNVKIIQLAQTFAGESDEPQFGISITVNNKNIHRAIITQNITLLRNILKSDRKISQLNPFWSSDFPITPFDLALMTGFKEGIKILMDENQQCDVKFGIQATPQLAKIETGNVSKSAYGVRTRKVNMSRGGREGNNAFLEDLQYMEQSINL